jgi:hypothetical protein
MPTISPIPCSDVKDTGNPHDIILIGEVHVGSLADAIKNYPSLASKLQAAAAKFAKDKEPLLLKLIDSKNPNANTLRARDKMNEFLAAGIPISKSTQDAIMAALPAPMRPQPTPTPTPSDGLD